MPDIKKDAMGTILKVPRIAFKPNHKGYKSCIDCERTGNEKQAQHTASILCPQYFEAGKKETEDKYKKAMILSLPPRYLRKVIEYLEQGKFPEEE